MIIIIIIIINEIRHFYDYERLYLYWWLNRNRCSVVITIRGIIILFFG